MPQTLNKPFLLFLMSNIKYAFHCGCSCCWIAVRAACWRSQLTVICLKSTVMARCHAEALDTITVNFAHLSVQFGAFVQACTSECHSFVTCSSNLSSPSMTAWFHCMTSENGSSQPLLSSTGMQAAWTHVAQIKKKN